MTAQEFQQFEIDPGDPFHRPDTVAKIFDKTVETLAQWRSKGFGPRFFKVGSSVFYRESAIREWLRAQEREPIKSTDR